MREPLWLDERDAPALHDRLIAEFGGPAGVRDIFLLQSALARPRQLFSYSAEADLPAFAAAYTSGVVGNHPFVDGNKRTGFVLGILFLELNELRMTTTEDEAANAVLALASHDISESEYAAFLREHSHRSIPEG